MTTPGLQPYLRFSPKAENQLHVLCVQIHEACPVTMGLSESVQSINTGQTVRTTQANLDPKYLLSVNLMHVLKRKILHHDSVGP